MVSTRQKIGHVLRKLHLIAVADKVLFYWESWKLQKKNRRFLSENPGFNPPPRHLAFDAYNHVDYEAYQRDGEGNAHLIAEIIKRHMTDKRVKILEWGCGPARILRHLATFSEFDEAQIFGSDYNEETIAWCKKSCRGIDFALNNLVPPLPYESGEFDFVYAVSVFTHLSEQMHYEWLLDIARVLTPQGLFIFSTHGDYFLDSLSHKEKAAFLSGHIVVRGEAVEGKKSFGAYHPEKFVRQMLAEKFEVLDYFPGTSGNGLGQDIWVAKKR